MSWTYIIFISLAIVCNVSSLNNSPFTEFTIRMSMSVLQDAKPINISTNNGKIQNERVKAIPAQLSLAKIFQNNMVLQRAPKRARIYGFSPNIGAKVLAQMITPKKMYYYSTTVVQGPAPGVGSWSVTLDPMNITDPVTIKFVSHAVSITLSNVLFGDVWLCSGQSNMQFTVAQMFNGDQEAQGASNYPNIRLFSVSKVTSPTPLYDLQKVDESWTQPSVAAVSNAPWTYFSSVCWLFGKNLHQTLGYPIGLVATDWGGTPVEAWSSPDALAKCHVEKTEVQMDKVVDKLQGPEENSCLWNSMIHPLLGMTIYGSIWYQGEDDSLLPVKMNRYNCTFPAMIQDWRSKFNMVSQQQTSNSFPFGFVQLAPNRPDPNITVGFPDIRWHQTADFGIVPNPRMPNTFMAVTMDLPDFKSKWGAIHPRDKEDVGQRLALAGLTLAYNMTMGEFQGPLVVKGHYTPPASLILEYKTSHGPIQVKNLNGFEILCQSPSRPEYLWYPLTIKTHTSSTLSFDTSVCGGGHAAALRYAWRESPCPFKACAVYSTDNTLPAPPFIFPFVNTADGKMMLDIKWTGHD